MKDILFRAKAINRDKGSFRTKYKNGDWVYGLVTRLYDERFENLPAEMTNTDGISGIEVDYKTIGQYTGLTDKNGTPIYEGDIVEARLRPIEVFSKCYVIGKVVFENGTFKISVYKSENAKEYKEYTGENIKEYPIENNFINRNYQLKIIGNIYDNPELLKGE